MIILRLWFTTNFFFFCWLSGFENIHLLTANAELISTSKYMQRLGQNYSFRGKEMPLEISLAGDLIPERLLWQCGVLSVFP